MMNEYMQIAKDLADQNLVTNDGGPFGACIVKDGQVIGNGSNHVLKNNDPTAHAEVMAIRDACKFLNTYNLSGCVLYTSCFPCPMCMSAIIWSNINMVYYGNTKEDADNIGFKDNIIYDFFRDITSNKDNTLVKFEKMDRDETIKSFIEYEKKTDKEIY